MPRLFFLAALAFFASPLHAASPKVRALPIPNIDPELVNSKGILVGYYDDDLVTVDVARTDKQVLLEDVRYHISLLRLTERNEVIYSVQENDQQVVRGLSLGKNHTVREILRRDDSYPGVLVNNLGDVAVRETFDDGDYMVIRTQKGRTVKLKVPEYYYPHFLTDDGAVIGAFSEYNDDTNQTERHLLLQDFSKRKKVRTVISKPINRSVHAIVAGNAAGKIFGLADPIDGDETTESETLFTMKIPGNNFIQYGSTVDGEELQGVWNGRLAIRSAYSDNNPRTTRFAGPAGAVSAISCNGLTGATFEFYDGFGALNFALAELRATDAQNSFRIETVVLVPAKSKIGAKITGQWSCQLR